MNFLVSFQFQLPSWPLNQPAGRPLQLQLSGLGVGLCTGRVVEPKSYFTTLRAQGRLQSFCYCEHGARSRKDREILILIIYFIM